MEIKNLLKNKGLRTTKKRIGILKVLENIECPVDVLGIRNKLIEGGIEINLSQFIGRLKIWQRLV